MRKSSLNPQIQKLLDEQPILPAAIIKPSQIFPIESTSSNSGTIVMASTGTSRRPQTEIILEDSSLVPNIPLRLKLRRARSLDSIKDSIEKNGILIDEKTLQKVTQAGNVVAQTVGVEQLEVPESVDNAIQSMRASIVKSEEANQKAKEAIETNYTRRLLTAFGLTTMAVGGAFAYGFLVRSGAIAAAPVTIEETKTITIFGKEVIKLVTQIKK
jgi:hypothetical protein